MARTGMLRLIAELRGMTDAGEQDYSIGGVLYWSDDQLQAALDRHRLEVVHEQLVSVLEYGTDGAASVTRYFSRHSDFEATTGGTAIFYVQDGLGAIAGTATYTADYAVGSVTFASHSSGPYYLTGRSYDLNAAAADVWERKAAHMVSASYSWSSDNMRVDKTGARKEAVEMARYYRGLAGPTSITMERGDTDGG